MIPARTTRIAPIACLLIAASAVGIAASVPASAATGWHVDPTGDVLRHDPSTGATSVSKTTAATDVTGVSSAYSSGAGLKVGTSLRSYRGLDGSWAARVVTSKGDTYFVQTSLSDGEVLLILQKPVSGEDEIIECEGLSVARTDHGITANCRPGVSETRGDCASACASVRPRHGSPTATTRSGTDVRHGHRVCRLG